jgi:hypothetical protein
MFSDAVERVPAMLGGDVVESVGRTWGGWTFVLQNRRNGRQDRADGLQGADREPSIARFTMSDARVELRGASLLWSGAGCVVQDGRFQVQGAGFALWEECYWMSNG